jgi:hypothetical protein
MQCREYRYGVLVYGYQGLDEEVVWALYLH